MAVNWNDLFDVSGIKSVSPNDKARWAYVPTDEQKRALDAAGLVPADGGPAPGQALRVLGDSSRTHVTASYYRSKGHPRREHRLGREFISEWLTVGDEVLVGARNGQLFVAKVQDLANLETIEADILLELGEGRDARLITRLSATQLRQVRPVHIRQAVDRLLAGADAPNFSPSRDYDVVASTGERLAPKKVFGLAIEQALGIEAFPAHFSAGWGQPCFEIIQEAGFVILDKVDPTAQPDRHSPTPPDQEELSWAEGNPRFAEHLRTERRRSRQAVAAKRAHVRAHNEGKLVCENPKCTADWYGVFPFAMAEAVFEIHHTVLVSEMKSDHRTSLDDLLCLCAACHRAEHRRLTLEDR